MNASIIAISLTVIGLVVYLSTRRETNMSLQPRGIRNNNPGNIEYTSIEWLGQIGNDGRYAVFSDAVFGIRAMALEIYDSIVRDGDDTIRKLINQWAPPTENLTGAYAAAISRQTGIGMDEKLLYERDVQPLIEAIIQHENGVQPYSLALIQRAIREAGK